MKKLIFALILTIGVAFVSNAQTRKFTYDGRIITFGMNQFNGQASTSWDGWYHFWGQGTNGIKMHIHAADARMSTTTNKLVFMDSERTMYIDLYCRTMYQSSDLRLKTNVQPLRKNVLKKNFSAASYNTNSLVNKVMQLNPVSYRWNDESEYEKYNVRPVKGNVGEYGFIAQEVVNVIPNAVAIDNEGNYLVNYTAIIPLLTGAIQELNERITELESEVARLKSK